MRTTLGLRRLVLGATLFVSLTGCASLPADRCTPIAWYTAGLEDGRAGRAADALSLRAGACAPQGIQPDEQSYSAGRTIGLADYCTLAGGIHAGRSGEPYVNVCPHEREDEFLTGYYLGALSADN